MTPPRSSGALYTPQLLGLATSLADYPLDAAAPFQGQARSQSCGSTLSLGFEASADETLASPGAQVTACAIGQASAALFLNSASGRSLSSIADLIEPMRLWVTEGADMPDWPGLGLLEEARKFSARHGAILLPWNAFGDALSKRGGRR